MRADSLGMAPDGHRFTPSRVLDTFNAPEKAAMIYRANGNIRTIQIHLGHTTIENTVRYLGVDVEDSLLLAE